MFNTLRRLYLEDRLNRDMLGNAVLKSWITEEQKQEILSANGLQG